MKFKVESVNIAAAKGVAKHEVPEIVLRENFGIEGDAHAGAWHRQVSLLAGEAIDAMKAKGLALAPGAFGENIVTRGVDWSRAKVGETIAIGDSGAADHPDRQGVPQPLCHILCGRRMHHAQPGDFRQSAQGRKDQCSK